MQVFFLSTTLRQPDFPVSRQADRTEKSHNQQQINTLQTIPRHSSRQGKGSRPAAESLARAKRLDKLAARQAAAWREVEERIASRQTQNYADQKKYEKRLRDIRERHGRKRTFMAGLDKAGLP